MAFDILVVDDSSLIRKALLNALDMAEFPTKSIMQAGDGHDALTQLNGKWVDVIFSDLNMPVMNGFDFIKEVKESPLTKDIPIIVISTKVNETKKDFLKLLGVDYYITKPFVPEVIRDTLVDLLGEWT